VRSQEHTGNTDRRALPNLIAQPKKNTFFQDETVVFQKQLW
jgi:hypothetical protein